MTLFQIKIIHTYYDTKFVEPDEEGGGHQHHGEVDGHSGLEIKVLEECCGVADSKEKKGG